MKANRKHHETIDEYIADFPSDVQTILQKIRETIRKAAPTAPHSKWARLAVGFLALLLHRLEVERYHALANFVSQSKAVFAGATEVDTSVDAGVCRLARRL